MTSMDASNSILIKFETRSNRVKGLSFHPRRPWILASLHNGAIQLWDYRIGSLIDRFEEHEGPVRGVDFHENQPLFVSGGDDFKIKLWNYKLKRCLFTLTGHLDYVRTVQFHLRLPWVVSASDDQTLRIWNWQGRSCMSVLTGHNHYVMSAAFHPRRDLVVSASLDQTLRLWDLSGLKSQASNKTFASHVGQDLFGGSDVQVKFMLDGHERGVNYASFHPTLPFIVSGADDRLVRTWRVEETRAYEIEQFKGHTNNVTCVMYFKDYIVSCSEDKSIRVWDIKVRSAIYVSRRDCDRFWVLAVHPERNLIAAGHDTGMIVFKLERERPAMQIVDNTLYWVKQQTGDKYLRAYNFETQTETTELVLTRRLISMPHTMSFCKEENMVVFYYAEGGGSFELYKLGKNTGHEDVQRGFYTSAVFFKKNKFAVLDKEKQIIIKNIENHIQSVLKPVHNVDEIFWAPNSHLLLKSEDKVHMFDPYLKKVTAQVTAAKVKYVVWSPDTSKVALLSKHCIGVFHKKGLKNVCSLHENSRVKSACFDDKAIVLLYSTLNHLKYCLQNGDTGTIKTLDTPIYLVKVVGDEVSYLDREGAYCTMKIDTVEYRFKLALLSEKWNEVHRIVKSTRVYGQALVSYLQQRGFPEVAMHFVKDPKTRFRLAIDCGNLDDAQECAEKLNNEESWSRLAQAAMAHGKVSLMNTCHNKTGTQTAHQHLSFLNFLVGDDNKARDYADMQREDVNVRFQTALFTNDVESRIKLLENAGQYTLAHQVALRHGMTEKAEMMVKLAGSALMDAMVMPPQSDDEEEESEDMATIRAKMEMQAREKVYALTTAMQGATGGECLDVTKKQKITSDWPMTRIDESPIMAALMKGGQDVDSDRGSVDDEAGGGGGGWDTDSVEGSQKGSAKPGDDSDDGGSDGGGWGSDSTIEVPVEETLAAGKGSQLPNAGSSVPKRWCENSKLAPDHIAAGSFETGMKLLRAQYGVKDFQPLKPLFIQCRDAATASAPTPGQLPSHLVYLNRSNDKLPISAITMDAIAEKCKVGSKATTDGKFSDGLKAFSEALQMSVMLVPTEAGTGARQAMVKDARCYASVCALQLALAETSDPKTVVERTAYATHYELKPRHMLLVLKQAMNKSWSNSYYATAGKFARRIQNYNPDAKLSSKANGVIRTSEAKEDASQLNYDSRNPFEICVRSWSPMYTGTDDPIYCSLCGAPALSKFGGTVCPICGIGEFGFLGSGSAAKVFPQ